MSIGHTLDIRQASGSHEPLNIDRNGLELLDRAECLRLLAQRNFGRVGLTLGALPTILPVTYRLIEGRVVFRTGVGQKLAAATEHAVIAFEVDEMDALSHSGWSVVVTGVAEEVVDTAEIRRLDRFGIPRWTPSGQDRVVALSPDLISGRRLTPGGSH
jgi:nitroimidazol reductase NimA-like FMN-containing flavoprotein (pyridoxamine 5'-phosphate oxidase superfamily)